METYDLVIVGAGCAGLTAAIYAARAGRSVLVLEQETIGGQIAYAPRVENYPGLPATSGSAMADALFAQAEALGVELELEQVQKLIPGEVHRLVTDRGERLARRVILATGTHRRKLGLPREDDFAGKGLSYCAVCDGAFYKGQPLAVIGGGSAALQSAELLAGLSPEVHLIHRRDEFRGEETLLRRVEALPQVTIHRSARATALLGGTELTGLRLSGPDGERELPVSGVFVCAGQEPNTAPFAPPVRVDEAGYFDAPEDCRTNLPGVFVAGDCRRKAVRQLTTASADGAVAALAALEGL